MGQSSLRGRLPVPRDLQYSDLCHLQAAIGWLELADHLEANEELEQVTPRAEHTLMS